VKSLILRLVDSSRIGKQSFLVLLDFLVFPVLLWLCYAVREFNLGAEVVPNLAFGSIWISALAVAILIVTGTYHFIVRSFNEAFFARAAFATGLMVLALYGLAYCTPAFIPTSIPVMFGFAMFAWIWFSRGVIRFVIKSLMRAEVPRKRVAIYGAGYAGQQVAALLNRSDEHFPVFFIDDDASLSGQIIASLKIYNAEQACAKVKLYIFWNRRI